MKKKYYISILFLYILNCFNIYADENESIFIIDSFIFNITGLTKQYALERNGDLKTGVELQGYEELENYISEKRQLLYNNRVLDSVTLEYSFLDTLHDGKIPVEITIITKDTWNIVVIPRPRYSSSSGFDITIKARDYNFLGTMSPLRLDIGYEYDNNKESTFLFELDSNLPFRLFSLNWNFKFFNGFHYRPGAEQPYFYGNGTGLSAEIPFGRTRLIPGFDENIFYNEENQSIDKPVYGEFQDGLYMSSNPYVSWVIPTGLEIGEWGELTYTPKISAAFTHELNRWPLDEIRYGPSLSFNHTLGFNKVDWIGNFLKGFDVSFYNSFSFNFYRHKNNIDPWNSNIRLNFIVHYPIDDVFAIYSRVMYRRWFFNEYTDRAGSVLRGIIDNKVSAEYMLSVNIDLPFKIFYFNPSDWLFKSNTRFFNFEFHLAPFIDAAVYRDPELEILYKGADFTYKNMLVTAGMEAIIFPEFFRSLFLRVSLGFNLSTSPNTSRYEIYLGTELHY